MTQWPVVGRGDHLRKPSAAGVAEHAPPGSVPNLRSPCDNRSEFLNYYQGRLLNKLLLEFTKSRAYPRYVEDGKNGGVVVSGSGIKADRLARQSKERSATEAALRMQKVELASLAKCRSTPRLTHRTDYGPLIGQPRSLRL